MKRYGALWYAQVRRVCRFYPFLLAFTLLMTAGIAALFGGVLAAKESGESRQPITIGLVGDIEGTYFEMGIYAVENFDSSQYYLEFTAMSEQEAIDAVGRGDIMAYLHIPDGFVEAMMAGEDCDITFVAGNSPSSLGPLLMQEIASIISDSIVYAQKGVYGLSDVMVEQGVPRGERRDAMNEISILYATSIFGRETVARVDMIGVGGGLNFAEYYVCAGVLLILLLCGVVCAPLLIRTDLTLPRMLRVRGFSVTGQVLAEYVPFAAVICGTVIVLVTAMGVFLSADTSHGVLTHLSSVWDYFGFAVKLIPALLLLTMWQFLVYELTHHIISGVLLQVMMTLGLCYASGYLLPLSALPPTLQTLSAYLPTGAALQYTAAIATDTADIWMPIGVLLYAVVLGTVAVLCRRRALGREGAYA